MNYDIHNTNWVVFVICGATLTRSAAVQAPEGISYKHGAPLQFMECGYYL